MATAPFSALIGYAIGTAQILILDWFRSRLAHRRQLRLLRAELRRASEFREKFQLREDEPDEPDKVPRPASLSPRFIDTVAAVDFWLTDEHRDDNSQQAFLTVADGLSSLAEVHTRFTKELDASHASDDKEKQREHREWAIRHADEYDREHDTVHFIIHDALRDLDRRLALSRFWPQAWRLLRPMPKGVNPPSLTRDDPRLIAFKQSRLAKGKDS